MSRRDEIRDELRRRGISRREFMEFCGAMASVLALPQAAAAQIAEALETRPKPSLVWLEFQDCAGNTESFLRATKPSAAEVILDLLSVDYHETIMAAAGHQAEAALQGIVDSKPGEYIAVVEGSIPVGASGGYCMVGGRAALDIAREVCEKALATVAVGTCAAFGGIPAAAPNPTGALSVSQAVPNVGTLINLSACPANAENITALLVYFLTYGSWPATDHLHRPLFAYGTAIHDACERRAHYDTGQFVREWGDEAHRAGHCLYEMGCKGPLTFQNCPDVRWNDGTNWPIGCGHPCVGCAEPNFWDTMTPFYRRVTGIPGLGPAANVDAVGAAAVGAVAVGFGAHALVQLGARTRVRQKAAKALEEAAAAKGVSVADEAAAEEAQDEDASRREP